MRKTLLALCILASASQSAQAVELFNNGEVGVSLGGSVDVYTYVEDSKTGASEASLNINVESAPSENGIIVGAYYEVDFSETESPNTEYMYVNFKYDWHELQFGYTGGSSDWITGYTVILDDFDGNADYTNTLSSDGGANQVLYSGWVGDVALKAHYSFGDNHGTKQTLDLDKFGPVWYEGDVDKGWGIAASYEGWDGISIGMGYTTQNEKNVTYYDYEWWDYYDYKDETTSNDFMAGASYKDGDFYIGALYINGTVLDQDFTSYEVATSYYFIDGLFTGISYQQAEFDHVKTRKNLSASIDYYLNKYTYVYIARFQDLESIEENSTSIGVNLSF